MSFPLPRCFFAVLFSMATRPGGCKAPAISDQSGTTEDRTAAMSAAAFTSTSVNAWLTVNWRREEHTTAAPFTEAVIPETAF